MPIIRVIPAGDLALVGGTLAFVDGPQLVRQRLMSRFRFFLGEWFLDQRLGVPYFRDVLVKNPDLGVIRSLFRRLILTTPGVLSLTSFELLYDDSARTLSFDFSARVTGGNVVVTPDDLDFILDVAA